MRDLGAVLGDFIPSFKAYNLSYCHVGTRGSPFRTAVLRTQKFSLYRLIVIQAIVALANNAMIQAGDPGSQSQGQYIFPVKGCMFFGVPHKGAEIADKAFGFLSVLSHLFNVNKHNVRDLKSRSQEFAEISSQFRMVQSEHSIPVMSFFETVKFKSFGRVSGFFTV